MLKLTCFETTSATPPDQLAGRTPVEGRLSSPKGCRAWTAWVAKSSAWLLAIGLSEVAFAQPSLPLPPDQTAYTETEMAPAGGPMLQLPAGALRAGAMNTAPAVIQPVQNTAQSARALHHLIQAMPNSYEDLEVIERRSQIIITRANVVRIAIADPTVIDVLQYSPRELSVIGVGRNSATTTLTIWFENVPEPLNYLVKVVRDPNADNQRRVDYGKLEQKLQKLFPNSKVYLIPMSFKIVVRGQARDQEEAAHILNIIRGEVINQEGSLLGPGSFAGSNQGVLNGGVGNSFDTGAVGGFGGGIGGGRFGAADALSGLIVNELRVPGEYQIAVTMRVAELKRSELNKMGTDLNVLFANSRQVLRSSLGGGAGTVGGIFEQGEISIFLDWLKTNGVGTILSEPTVTVISGRPARFLAGGEFAVPTIIGIGGAQGQSTAFRGYGTSVLATPTIVDRDLIRMQIIAEYSQLDQGAAVNGIPGTQTRRVDTSAELREGQTLALAGLYSNLKRTEISRIPFLGDIPKVGPLLFSNKRTTQDENELLFLVTPELVRPMDAHEVPPVPGFEYNRPTDHEFYFYNRIESNPDTGHHQLPPYGSGSVGTNVGYQHFNPGPASQSYSPQPTGGGFSGPAMGQPVNGASPMYGTSANRPQPVPDPNMRAAVPRPQAQRPAPANGVRPAGFQPAPQGRGQVTPTNYNQSLQNAGAIQQGQRGARR